MRGQRASEEAHEQQRNQPPGLLFSCFRYAGRGLQHSAIETLTKVLILKRDAIRAKTCVRINRGLPLQARNRQIQSPRMAWARNDAMFR